MSIDDCRIKEFFLFYLLKIAERSDSTIRQSSIIIRHSLKFHISAATGPKNGQSNQKETLALCYPRVGHRADRYRRARWPALLLRVSIVSYECQDVCSRFNLIIIVLVLVLEVRILWVARDEYEHEDDDEVFAL